MRTKRGENDVTGARGNELRGEESRWGKNRRQGEEKVGEGRYT